jgi:hypothetical protein
MKIFLGSLKGRRRLEHIGIDETMINSNFFYGHGLDSSASG